MEEAAVADVPTEIRRCVVFLGYLDANRTEHVAGSAAVAWASGTKFSSGMVGGVLWINNVAYVISSVSLTTNTSITLATSAGTQTGVTLLLLGSLDVHRWVLRSPMRLATFFRPSTGQASELFSSTAIHNCIPSGGGSWPCRLQFGVGIFISGLSLCQSGFW